MSNTRKYIGCISSAVLVVIFFVWELLQSRYFGFVLPNVLFMWYAVSLTNKMINLASGRNVAWLSILSVVLGIGIAIYYLVVFSSTASAHPIFGVIFSFLWLVDLIDLAIQKTCKA